MSDLIERQAAVDALCSVCGYDCDKSEFVYDAPQDEQVILCPEHYALTQLPSAQPEPESAQWVQMFINRRMYKCSNCQVAWNKRLVFDNDGYSEKIFMKYCPCCGRKMRTEVDYEQL